MVTTPAPGTQSKSRLRSRNRSRRDSGGLPYLLILPACLVLAVVTAWPLIKIVQLSLQQQQSGKYALFHSGGATPFVGLKNFENVLSDSTFWSVLIRTLIFTAVNVALSLLI